METPVRLRQVTSSEERRQGCVEVLEQALEKAKAGELDAVMVIFDYAKEDRTEYSYQGYRFPEMIGNIERLKFQMLYKNCVLDE